jgi:hypothetical protein
MEGVLTKNTALSGMKAIQDFCRSIGLPSAESTVINFILSEDFPAKKLGGIWESDKDLIVEWRKKRLTVSNGNGSAAMEPEKKPEPRKNEQKKNRFGLRR